MNELINEKLREKVGVGASWKEKRKIKIKRKRTGLDENSHPGGQLEQLEQLKQGRAGQGRAARRVYISWT